MVEERLLPCWYESTRMRIFTYISIIKYIKFWLVKLRVSKRCITVSSCGFTVSELISNPHSFPMMISPLDILLQPLFSSSITIKSCFKDSRFLWLIGFCICSTARIWRLRENACLFQTQSHRLILVLDFLFLKAQFPIACSLLWSQFATNGVHFSRIQLCLLDDKNFLNSRSQPGCSRRATPPLQFWRLK